MRLPLACQHQCDDFRCLVQSKLTPAAGLDMCSNQHAGSGCPNCIFKANSQKVKISCLVLSARHGKSTLWRLLFCTQGNRSQHLLVQTQLFNNHQHKSTCEVQCWLSPDIGCINLLKDCLAVTAFLVAIKLTQALAHADIVSGPMLCLITMHTVSS